MRAGSVATATAAAGASAARAHVAVRRRIAAPRKVAESAGDHALDRLARFRIVRERRVLHALLKLKAARGLGRIGGLVDVSGHSGRKENRTRGEVQTPGCVPASTYARKQDCKCRGAWR